MRRNGDSVDKKNNLQLIGFEHKMHMFMASVGYDWKNKTDQVSFILNLKLNNLLRQFNRCKGYSET